MDYKIPMVDFPEEVEESNEYTPEELGRTGDRKNPNRNIKEVKRGASFHEKKAKNMKTNQRRERKKKSPRRRKKR